MVKRLDSDSRDILQFRPTIEFIEPDIEDQAITPVIERPQLEDIEKERTRIKQLAKAVNTLATAVQARVDEKAKGMRIRLDPLIDQDAIQAMRRRYPTKGPAKGPIEITYQQYKECKEELRAKGYDLAKQSIIDADQIKARRDEVQISSLAGTRMGGFNTPEAADGRLRPELDSRARIIEPLDIQRLQIDLICILINFLWKNFIKPIIVSAAPPVSWAFSGLPDKICDPGGGIEIPDLFILGDEIPDILTGKGVPKIPTGAPEI